MTGGQAARVLMTADAVGGVWTYALDLTAGLRERGLEVTVAVLGPPPTDSQRNAARALNAPLIETGLPLDWLAEDAETVARSARRLSALADGHGTDLVHLNSPALAADAGFSVPVLGVCHSCMATWWDAVRGGDLPEDFGWRSTVLARGYLACDALIAPSLAFAGATHARYGVAPRCVSNGRRAGGRTFHPESKRRVVFTSGRLWDPGKNVAALDDAADLMRREVVAAGPLEGPTGELVALSAMTALGALDDRAMTDALNEAAVFASLALYEPFGLGVLEAAQSGCALVLSDIPTFRELWTGAAVFVSPDNAQAVAATLDALLDQPSETERLGRLAAARAATFSIEAAVDGTLAAYQAIVAIQPPRMVAVA